MADDGCRQRETEKGEQKPDASAVLEHYIIIKKNFFLNRVTVKN